LTYSFTAHGSDIMDSPKQVGLDQTVQRASFVAAVCSFGRNQICRWIPHSLWSKVVIVRCGLEPGYGERSAELAAEQCLSPVFVCIGRLSPEKGQLQLIDAARILATEGMTPRIVLAGDGPMRSEVEALIKANGLEGSVSITGWLSADQVRSTLETATALVVPSMSEGLPVVIMEAMASARPVIAPYLAGIPELVQHGTTGWLYPAGDVAALAGAMRACILTSPDAMLAMGRDARSLVWRFHDVASQTKLLASRFPAKG
jgi:glycosyltransferase involved in cell wall biosynthesis